MRASAPARRFEAFSGSRQVDCRPFDGRARSRIGLAVAAAPHRGHSFGAVPVLGAPIQAAGFEYTKGEIEGAGLGGHTYLFGAVKSSWAKLLGAIESYNKASGDDYAGRLQALSSVVAHAQSWRASGSRTKRGLSEEKQQEESGKLELLDKLQPAAEAELEQVKYIQDIAAGKYMTRSGNAAIGKALVAGDHARAGLEKEAADLVTKNELSAAEAAAIKIYTTQAYKYINPALTGDTEKLERNLNALHKDSSSEGMDRARREGKMHAKMAASGMAKLPSFVGEVYSGAGVTDEGLAGYKLGAQIDYKDFTSTSKKKSIAIGFMDKKKKEGRNGVLLTIDCKTGKEIAALSDLGSEDEVLYAPDQSFTVAATERVDAKKDKAHGPYLAVKLAEQGSQEVSL